jgi:hypothetical protein
VAKAPPPVADPHAKLRRELLRWSLCRTFKHQFALIARPKAKPKPRGDKQGGKGDDAPPKLWRPWRQTHPKKPKLGLAAAKHKQAMAARGKQAERAFGALARAQMAARADWPDDMRRELQACRTPEQQRLWAEKWAEHLSGRARSDDAPDRPSVRHRAAAWRRPD